MRLHKSLAALVLLVTLLCSLPASAATLVDSESASHDDAAARYQIQAVYQGSDLKIVQFNLAVLSHYSYLVISDGKVLAVDPGRDIKTYLDYATSEKLEWVGTFLTHSHADFVAGHLEMAMATGQPIYVSHAGGAEYTHVELREGSNIEVGKALVRILETPGHTPDSLCGIVVPSATPDRQEFLLSGDTLFVGSLGRPDLMAGRYSAGELAGMMFDTWTNKLAKLSDNLVVLPAHGAGSLCGANLSDAPSSTIAEEKRSNYYLKYTSSRSAFIARFLTGIEPAPQYFGENARMNRVGPEIVDWSAVLGQKVADLAAIVDDPEVYVVDVRDDKSYAASHIPRSVNIALRGRFETWVGIIVPFKARLILTGSLTELEEAGRRLQRVGYRAEHVIFSEYAAAGGTLATTILVTPLELHEKMLRGEAPLVIDVRRPAEWQGMKIGEVLNIPLDTLEKQAPGRLNRDEPVIAVCNSAFRSNLAIGLLERAGFKSATSMAGGSEAWIEAGFPIVRIDAAGTPAVAAAADVNQVATPVFRNLGLPERITASQLQQMAKDLPGTFEIIDIRPFEQVEDYNPTGARVVDLGDLLENQTWLVGDVPLVIVDRDGSLAMMAAGILSRKTHRPIKALLGGIEAFWRATELGFMRDRMIMPSVNPIAVPSAPLVEPPPVGSGERPTFSPLDSGEITPQQNQPATPAVPAAKTIRKGAGC